MVQANSNAFNRVGAEVYLSRSIARPFDPSDIEMSMRQKRTRLQGGGWVTPPGQFKRPTIFTAGPISIHIFSLGRNRLDCLIAISMSHGTCQLNHALLSKIIMSSHMKRLRS